MSHNRTSNGAASEVIVEVVGGSLGWGVVEEAYWRTVANTVLAEHDSGLELAVTRLMSCCWSASVTFCQ